MSAASDRWIVLVLQIIVIFLLGLYIKSVAECAIAYTSGRKCANVNPLPIHRPRRHKFSYLFVSGIGPQEIWGSRPSVMEENYHAIIPHSLCVFSCTVFASRSSFLRPDGINFDLPRSYPDDASPGHVRCGRGKRTSSCRSRR